MRGRDWLGHPLLGNDLRGTRRGLRWLVLITVLLGSEALLGGWVPMRGTPPRLVWALDALTALAILTAALAAVTGIAYGLLNGGPLLAAGVPAVPVVVSVLVGQDILPTTDAAILIAGGAAGAGVATLRMRPAPTVRIDPVAVGIGTTSAFVTVAVWLVYRLSPAGSPRLLGRRVIAGLLIAVAVLTIGWVVSRSVGSARR